MAPRTSIRDRQPDRTRRLEQQAAAARAAHESGDGWAANEAWRRYRLVLDAGRDPQELLDEGVELSRVALDLARAGRGL